MRAKKSIFEGHQNKDREALKVIEKKKMGADQRVKEREFLIKIERQSLNLEPGNTKH